MVSPLSSVGYSSSLRQRVSNKHGNSSRVLNQVAQASPISSGESSWPLVSAFDGDLRLDRRNSRINRGFVPGSLLLYHLGTLLWLSYSLYMSYTLLERQGPLFQEDALSKRRCPAFPPGRAPALFPFQHKHRMADRRTLKILK